MITESIAIIIDQRCIVWSQWTMNEIVYVSLCSMKLLGFYAKKKRPNVQISNLQFLIFFSSTLNC